ncbi:hypothetical protein GCM10027073_72730 [Streptomyces chlorus]
MSFAFHPDMAGLPPPASHLYGPPWSPYESRVPAARQPVIPPYDHIYGMFIPYA